MGGDRSGVCLTHKTHGTPPVYILLVNITTSGEVVAPEKSGLR
jgi:hypothetical protein